MYLIERYILRRTLSLSLMTLVSTTVMVLITQVLIYVNVLTTSGQTISTFFALAATLVPAMVNIVLPFALYIGASQTLNTMNSDSELAVIESAGASPGLTGRPVAVLAIAFALVSLCISLLIEPWAVRHKVDIISRARADLISVAVQSGSFQRIEPRLYIQVAEQLPSGEYAGIFISDTRDARAELIYYARRGAIQDLDGNDVLALLDGEVHRKTKKTGELSIIRFGSHVIDLSQFGAAADQPSYRPGEQPTWHLLFGDTTDDYFSKFQPSEVRAELNRRFSDWLYPLAFAMIAILSMARATSNRQERLWSLTVGAAIAVALRGAGFYFVANSGDSRAIATLAFAVPLTTILVIAALVITKRSLHISSAITDPLAVFGARIARYFPRGQDAEASR